jgi:hypothetical protein
LSSRDPEEKEASAGKWTHRWRLPLLIVGAFVALALVVGFGLYQFRVRAKSPIDKVKTEAIHGTDVTNGDGILDFIKSKGIKVVSEGFKPTWGAEQVGDHEWVVSYVFEVGRQSHWATWRVNTNTGSVTPVNTLARQIQGGGP